MKDDFHRGLSAFSKPRRQKHPENKINFGRKLKDWLPMVRTTKIKGQFAHDFPPIDDCKTAIEATFEDSVELE